MTALFWFPLLVLPVISIADINIDVIASEFESECQAHVSGSAVDIISDVEIDTFQLYGVKLKKAVKAYLGATPDDVFLKSPTPWNDLYKTIGWRQVNRILKPIRVKMLSIKYGPTLVLTQIYRNPSSKNATFKGRVHHDVEDTVASTWDTSGELTGLSISYGFNFLSMGVSGKASMSYKSKWGKNVMRSQTVTVGSETGLKITLQPNQSAKAELFAKRGVMTIQIDYEATLGGDIAVNYKEGYENHHFQGLHVDSVLRAGNMTTSVYSSENITLDYYMDSEVVVHDYDTDAILYSSNRV